MSEPSIDHIQKFFDKCVFGFMFHDIQAAIDGKANYLAALGLVAYTEFMGGLVNGTLGQRNRSKERFYAFWNRMGAEYRSAAAQRALDKIYSNVRSGLVHSYFIAQSSVVKMTKGDGHGQRCGVEVLEPGGKVIFIVEKYFDDFRAACQQYHRELVKERNSELIQRFEQAVGQQWFFNELIDEAPHD